MSHSETNSLPTLRGMATLHAIFVEVKMKDYVYIFLFGGEFCLFVFLNKQNSMRMTLAPAS